MHPHPDWRDARWFPLDYQLDHDAFLFVPMSAEALGAASFLDRRLASTTERSQTVAAESIPRDALSHRPALLLHTAFCCSTLLARALHAPPAVVALKEPLALTQLTRWDLDATRSPAGLYARLETALGLLGRPWSADGQVLVKPTNIVNRLAVRLVQVAAPARVVLLYASLQEFLVSCFKKMPEAETRIRSMAHTLLPGTRLATRLGLKSNEPFNIIESAVLTWYAQMETYHDLLSDADAHRLRSLDMDALLADPTGVVERCARWLGLDGALQGLGERVDSAFSRHAKSTDLAYGPAERAREKALLLARHGSLIAEAERWAKHAVQPHASLPRDWQPI
jgi:hypothetical protein